MLPNITICTGCGACRSICPKNAISMVKDEFCFLFPQVDSELCIHCGLCERTCPCLSTPNDSEIMQLVGIAASDDVVRTESSSGGLFTLLAEKVLQKNGVIVGCKLDDGCRSCSHICITNGDEIKKLRGSKYIQSDVRDAYQEVKGLLEDGKDVLFSGTPCQAAGLKKYLNKQYDNLLILSQSAGL